MQSSSRFENLKPTDRIYEKDGHIVKVRLLDVSGQKTNPFVFEITTSICKNNGKVKKRPGEFRVEYYIKPGTRHSVYLGRGVKIEEEMNKIIFASVDETIKWYKDLVGAESFLKAW